MRDSPPSARATLFSFFYFPTSLFVLHALGLGKFHPTATRAFYSFPALAFSGHGKRKVRLSVGNVYDAFAMNIFVFLFLFLFPPNIVYT